MSSSLQSLKYSRGSLSVIDQLKLPHELIYVEISSSEDAWTAIRTMQVRGAPLIAIVAALSLAVDVCKARNGFNSSSEAAEFLKDKMTYLRTSRPTAVNLFVATDALLASVLELEGSSGSTVDSVVDGFLLEAEAMLAADVATNMAIGDYGANRIMEITGKDSIKVLTICNTGSLATAGYGTALGVVRSLHAMGKLEHVYACETRPYNQGARLTAFEIVQDGLPGTLIADSMASALMAVKGVDCVIVGADRVAANGDTANKIGTYQLAIAAKYHNIPFFAAVPTTTLDLTMSSGALIHVEERPACELTSIFDIKIAPDGIDAWNPAFDLTPCSLIKGIITELGVAEAGEGAGADGIIDMAKFLKSKGMDSRCTGAVIPTAMPSGFQRLDEAAIAAYVSKLSKIRAVLGINSVADASLLTVSEIGDGNVNFVYIIEGPTGKVVAKQALPYVRCVGESWPLTLERAYFENNALNEERKLAPDHVPEVYHFNKEKALIIMRFVEAPNQILRKALIQGLKVTTFAPHLGNFIALTLYGSSALRLDGGTLRARVSEWSRNTAMCALTEQVVFTDPYTTHSNNRWTTPQLDLYAAAIKKDSNLQLAVAELKAKFIGNTESLLHGDLHSGSVMATEGETWVIDPEFAFYGPMGFDLGAIISNLLLSYFSQAETNGPEYAEWVLQQMVILYDVFSAKFIELWNKEDKDGSVEVGNGVVSGSGELFKGDLYATKEAKEGAQTQYMNSLWWDALGFSGLKMIRRIVGISHVIDLEEIVDDEKRSVCEKRCLILARELVLASSSSSIVTGTVAQSSISSSFVGLFRNKNSSVSTRKGLENVLELADRARSYYAHQPPEIWIQ